MKWEVTFYLHLSTEGSDRLNKESSKIFFSLVCLETQEHHICMFSELRWILCSQTLIIVFNIGINKEQNVLKCFFHIVNNIKEKEKSVKLGEMTSYFRIIVFSVIQSVSVCSYLPPSGDFQYYRTDKQNPSNSHQRAAQTQRSPKTSSSFCVAYEGNQTRTMWISPLDYFLASWNGFWPF